MNEFKIEELLTTPHKPRPGLPSAGPHLEPPVCGYVWSVSGHWNKQDDYNQNSSKMNNKSGIVFIHGAGLNSSIWDDLKNSISAPILAIDFPNRKEDDNANSGLPFDEYTRSVIEQISRWNKENIIIVAHSIGACVGLKVANHFDKELIGFVAIGSVIPTNGNSFVSSLPFPQKAIMPVILKLFKTKPPRKSIELELCNDLTSEQTMKVIAEFTPEAATLYTTKIKYTLPDTNRLYVKLTNDKSIPGALQDKMAKNLNAQKIIALDSGHLPMLSKPKQLASILSDFIDEVGQTITNR